MGQPKRLTQTEADRRAVQRMHDDAIEHDKRVREQRRIESINAPIYSENDMRELAEKVLAAINSYTPTTGNGLIAHSAVHAAVSRVFTESGVAVETKGGDNK
jgi:hypothetical protein